MDALCTRIDIEQLLLDELRRVAVSDRATAATLVDDVTRILDELDEVQAAYAQPPSCYGRPLFPHAMRSRVRDVLRATPTDVPAIKGWLHVMLLRSGVGGTDAGSEAAV